MYICICMYMYVYVCICMYMYVYACIYIYISAPAPLIRRNALLPGKNLGGTACPTLLVSNTASFVVCVFRRLKDHHNLPHCSPLLKKPAIDK